MLCILCIFLSHSACEKLCTGSFCHEMEKREHAEEHLNVNTMSLHGDNCIITKRSLLIANAMEHKVASQSPTDAI